MFSWLSKKTKVETESQTVVIPVDQIALAQAFIEGFKYGISQESKAVKEAAFNQAYTEAISQLDSLVEKRAQALGNIHPRPIQNLQVKLEEFKQRLSNTTNEAEKLKLQSYVDSLGWALNANGIPKN